jgi:glutamine synthetase
MAQTYRHVVLPAMDALRAPIDQLEMVVDSDFWPVPSYGDLMYNV